MLTSTDIALVRDSFARVAQIKDAAADLFYDRLFTIAPRLRALFPADLTEQKRKLMAMLATAVSKLDDLTTLVPAVKTLGARHAGYGTTAEHYTVVADALIWTLAQGLGEAFTADVKAAWIKVYGVLAKTMQDGAAEAKMQAAE
jgi:hemoglobin-like flavoprotein